MTKYIDADALLNQRPENLNNRCENYDKAVYASGWNDCNECWCDLIDGMPAADVEPVLHWISVDERLPEYEGSYLVCTAKSGAFIGHYYARSKSFTGGRGHITHWMNRPEPPKMDGGGEND